MTQQELYTQTKELKARFHKLFGDQNPTAFGFYYNLHVIKRSYKLNTEQALSQADEEMDVVELEKDAESGI